MSNQSSNSSDNSGMAFVLGGLVVAIVVMGYFVMNGGSFGTEQPDISITVPGVGSVEGSVKSE